MVAIVRGLVDLTVAIVRPLPQFLEVVTKQYGNFKIYGFPIEFSEDDFAVYSNCGNEFWNMDYVGEFLGDRTDRVLIQLNEDL